MPSLLEAAAEDRDAMAMAAKQAIDLRLQLLSGEDASGFWSAVAKLYARGMTDAATLPERCLP